MRRPGRRADGRAAPRGGRPCERGSAERRAWGAGSAKATGVPSTMPLMRTILAQARARPLPPFFSRRARAMTSSGTWTNSSKGVEDVEDLAAVVEDRQPGAAWRRRARQTRDPAESNHLALAGFPDERPAADQLRDELPPRAQAAGLEASAGPKIAGQVPLCCEQGRRSTSVIETATGPSIAFRLTRRARARWGLAMALAGIGFLAAVGCCRRTWTGAVGAVPGRCASPTASGRPHSARLLREVAFKLEVGGTPFG
jgi:hypothetical protein